MPRHGTHSLLTATKGEMQAVHSLSQGLTRTLPGAHAVHVEEATMGVATPPHVLHMTEPVDEAYCGALQYMQAVCPASDWYVPTLQSRHVVASVKGTNRPGEHAAH